MPALPLALALVICLLHALAQVELSAAASNVPRTGPDGEVFVDWTRAAPGNQALTALKREHLPEYFAAEVSELFHLPSDLTLAVGPCGAGLPAVPPAGRTIPLCTEGVRLYHRLAVEISGTDDQAADELFFDATLFSLYRELGRALPSVFDLPASARGPEAARRLGLWCLFESLGAPGEHGLATALNAADFFANAAQTEDLAPAERPYWQAQALTPETYADVLCLAVGYDPEQAEAILGASPEELLPAGRATGCEAEYDRLDADMIALLGRMLKAEPETARSGAEKAGAAAR